MEFGAGLKDVGVDGIVDVDALGSGEVSVAENGLLRQAVRHHGLRWKGDEEDDEGEEAQQEKEEQEEGQDE